MNLDSKNVDPKTGLIVYGTLGKIGSTDPEVDSAYLTCYYYYLNYLLGSILDWNYMLAVIRFTVGNGIFRRYPNVGQNKLNAVPEARFNNPSNLSRDNTLPIVISMGMLGQSTHLKYFMLQMLKRWSFFQNTHTHKGEKKIIPDLATPDHWATFIRAYVEARTTKPFITRLNKICLYVLLNFLDVFSVLQTLLYVIGSYIKPNETGSELNIICACIQRRMVMPTILGSLANFIYFNFIKYPTEFPTVGRYNDKAWIARVENFFSKGRRHKIMPAMDELIVELNDKFKF